MTHTPPGWIEPETVRVRPEAALDLAVVSRFLRPRLPNTDGPLEVVQFAGGHANLTYLLRFGTQEYVLRRPPSGPVAPGAYDMAREFRALSALWPVFPPAPRPSSCARTAVYSALRSSSWNAGAAWRSVKRCRPSIEIDRICTGASARPCSIPSRLCMR